MLESQTVLPNTVYFGVGRVTQNENVNMDSFCLYHYLLWQFDKDAVFAYWARSLAQFWLNGDMEQYYYGWSHGPNPWSNTIGVK